MNPELKPCALWYGRWPGSVMDLVRDRLGRAELGRPPWLTCEPIDGPRRIVGFHGLTRVDPVPAALSVPLVEARLHYAAGMLHLLQGAGHLRWAAWFEGVPATAPSWCPSAGPPAETPELLVVPGRDVLIEPADGTRGLAGHGTEKVVLHEYLQDGVLRWWRLSDP